MFAYCTRWAAQQIRSESASPNSNLYLGVKSLLEPFQSGELGTGSLAAMDEVKHDARGSGLISTWRLGLLEETFVHPS